MSATESTSLLRPGNALAALGIAVMKGLARLPFPWLQAIGRAVGSVAAVLFPYRRHVALVNLRLCFPDMTEKERRRLLRRHYQSMGIGMCELAAAWYKTDGQIAAVSRVTGLEHLRAVEESGRGALLLSAHFTTLEIAGRVLLLHHPFSCLYRRPNQPRIAAEMTRARASKMRKVIHMDEMNELIRALRDGHMIWYAPDQGKRIKYSEVLPFFGVPAVTNTATGRIAKMGKAAILPFLGYRLPDGSYRVDIFPELRDIPSDDPDSDALAINHIIEDFVRKAPDQYFWLHRRFKRRGPEYPDVYADK